MANKRLERARALNRGYVYDPPQGKVVITKEEVAAYLEAVRGGASHWNAMQGAGHLPEPGDRERFLASIGLDRPGTVLLGEPHVQTGELLMAEFRSLRRGDA